MLNPDYSKKFKFILNDLKPKDCFLGDKSMNNIVLIFDLS